ncbi:MAG: mercury resistance system transport protein MerF [SAR324 cluster bacterium]|nr:mercury resistance system transport protein MerF [SAR324 cluster bacterium]
MKNKTTFYRGIGTVLNALCCFTPILVIGLMGLGAVAIISYIDYVLFPLLAFFVVITV